MGDDRRLNSASEHGFLETCRHGVFCKGSPVLMENGNLRTGWKNGQGTHRGLRFSVME